MTKIEKVTFGTLCAAVVAVGLWWRLGIIMLCLLCGVSLFKTVCTRNFGNRGITTAQKVCLWVMVAYWILYAISALVSSNHNEGWNTAIIKLYFLGLPLCCLLGDTSYLTSNRLKALFQLFIVTLVVRFMICITISGIHLLQGIPFTEVKDWQFDPLGMHHNYLALYLDAALAMLYVIFVQTPKSARRRLPAIIVSAAILLLYLFLSSSRSGIITLVLLAIAILIHTAFFRKKWGIALAVLFLSGMLAVSLYFIAPSMFDRFNALRANRVADDRVVTWGGGLKTAQERLLFGYGSGDYMPYLLDTYEKMNYPKAVKDRLDAHNQYIETMLETGLTGLGLLLAMFFLPLAMALSRRRRDLLTALVILVITSQCFFESMLNRQMGVQFIALFYCLLILLQSDVSEGCSSDR